AEDGIRDRNVTGVQTCALPILARVYWAIIASAVSESLTGKPVSDFNKGNIKARQRMIAQYPLASETGTLVVGSDHAAEAITGFYTKFGDGAADLMPLVGLNKRQGAELLRYLGAPASTWEKVPTADLEEGRPM